jgi:hypothetical protein
MTDEEKYGVWVPLKDAIHGDGVMSKMKVEGGWLYRTVHVGLYGDKSPAVAMVFVPNP